MLDLTKKDLPNVVEINGRSYSIYTDFRVWMKFANNIKTLRGNERVFVPYLFKNDNPGFCALHDLLEFCYPPRELPRQVSKSKDIMFDYEIDADYIYAAFMSQYGIDLIEIEHLHWHKFLALFRGLKDDEMICRIMSYRGYEKDSKNDHRYERLKEAWRIEYTSPEEQAEIDKFSNMFT